MSIIKNTNIIIHRNTKTLSEINYNKISPHNSDLFNQSKNNRSYSLKTKKNYNNSEKLLTELLDEINKNSLNEFYKSSNSIFKKTIDELNLKFYLETEKYLNNKINKEKTENLLFIILFKQINVYIEEIKRLNLYILKNKYQPQNVIKRTDNLIKYSKDFEIKEQIIKTLKLSKKNLEDKYSELIKNENKLKKENEELKKQLNYLKKNDVLSNNFSSTLIYSKLSKEKTNFTSNLTKNDYDFEIHNEKNLINKKKLSIHQNYKKFLTLNDNFDDNDKYFSTIYYNHRKFENYLNNNNNNNNNNNHNNNNNNNNNKFEKENNLSDFYKDFSGTGKNCKTEIIMSDLEDYYNNNNNSNLNTFENNKSNISLSKESYDINQRSVINNKKYINNNKNNNNNNNILIENNYNINNYNQYCNKKINKVIAVKRPNFKNNKIKMIKYSKQV